MTTRHRVPAILPVQRLVVVAGLAAFALVAGACGGDDPAATSTPERTEAADPSTTTTAAPSTTTTTAAPAPDTTTTAEAPQTTEGTHDTTTTTTTETPPTTAAPAEPMTILVTNDDGYSTEGIDVIVEALLELPGVEVTVVAPLANQSGASDKVSPAEDGERPSSDVETASGYPAIAVDGTPGDSVNWALANVFAAEAPDLIVSGSNEGENIGPFAAISGTVGAARIGAREGIPGLAISQGGVTVEAEWSNGIGAGHVTDWITEHRDAILRSAATPAEVWSINVPSCAGTGEVRGYLELPLAEAFDEAAGEVAFEVDCGSDLTDLDDDTTAFVNGYATLTQIPESLVLSNE